MRQFSDEFIATLSEEQKDLLLKSIMTETTEEYAPAEKIPADEISVPKQRKRKARKKKPKVRKDFKVEREGTYNGGTKLQTTNRKIQFVDPGGSRGKQHKTPEYTPSERPETSRRVTTEVRCSICGTMFEKDTSLIYSGGIYHRCNKCSGV